MRQAIEYVVHVICNNINGNICTKVCISGYIAQWPNADMTGFDQDGVKISIVVLKHQYEVED